MKELMLDIIFNPITETVLAAALGVAFAKFKQYKALYSELYDVAKKYRVVRTEKSPGGKNITNDEWAELGKEIVEVIEAGGKLIKARRSK